MIVSIKWFFNGSAPNPHSKNIKRDHKQCDTGLLWGLGICISSEFLDAEDVSEELSIYILSMFSYTPVLSFSYMKTGLRDGYLWLRIESIPFDCVICINLGLLDRRKPFNTMPLEVLGIT